VRTADTNTASSRPLGDAPDRSYAAKLERFAAFIAPELRGVLAGLELEGDARVLDVGCGVGTAVRLFTGLLEKNAQIVGLDLSLPHLEAARTIRGVHLVQADAARLCFRDGSFDLIWSCNTVNHLADPVGGLAAMRDVLRPGGQIALAQSGFLPEMYFAWDAPLDEAVRNACHRYYRERYKLTSADTAGIRGLVGLMKRAGLVVKQVRTVNIERVQPLSPADRAYFEEAIFTGSWGERLRPYLTPAQWRDLERNTRRDSSAYCLDRDDFHHIQTLTVCVGHA
jgi:SAM-dependent methyltransferase